MQTYNHLNEYLKKKFGERVLKISIDGGFTCPNRDGTCGFGGCIFCNESGSGENKNGLSIHEQIVSHLNSYRGDRANKFIAYFQNFTNTYDSLENLKAKYDEAINASDKIVGLSIATRPDCINEDIAKLLASYKDKVYVQVELGLQTSNDNTAKLINRGYESQVFTNAVTILNKYGIDIVAHIMVGLPGENEDDLINTVRFLNAHNISGLKIHSTYVVKKTKLEDMYLDGQYKTLELEEYIDLVIKIITNLRNDIIIHRISGDAPKDSLVSPKWNTHKKLILNGVENKMKKDGLYQGMNLK